VNRHLLVSIVGPALKLLLIFSAIFFFTINLIATVILNVPMPEVGDYKFDVAIILGYPASEDGQPSPMLKQRVMKGVELFKHQSVQSLIMTGGAAHNQYVEASVMAKLAKSMGVPEHCIVQETRALNTYQNIFNSFAIMRERNWKSAIIVTSPNHLKRARYLASHYPIEYAMSSSGYPKSMPLLEQFVFEQWERYALTRDYFFGYSRPSRRLDRATLRPHHSAES
jgi:uncharacterized SAM-binding protein YcdF (DUF218 family)